MILWTSQAGLKSAVPRHDDMQGFHGISIHRLLLDSLLHACDPWPMGAPRFLSSRTSSIVCALVCAQSNMSWSPSSTSRPSGSMGPNLGRISGLFRDRWERWKTLFQRSELRVLSHDSGVCSLKHKELDKENYPSNPLNSSCQIANALNHFKSM